MYPAEFARVYDALMDDVDYPAWARHYCQIAQLAPGQAVCECGCGTGSMTVALSRFGLKMTGVDLSEAMLGVAADKARSAGQFIPFICQDMARLSLHRGVDAVIAPCDGVNYLLEDDRVRAFFAHAYRALKPGGRLAFDVSTAHKFASMAGAPFYEDREDISYFWLNEIDGQRISMSLTFFVRRPDGLYARFDEEQIQKAHSLDFLLDALKGAGFVDVRALSEHTAEAATARDSRWHVVAHRPD